MLDGAMGTMVQQYKLTESDYRGERFKDWKGKDLKGSIELLLLTKPDVIDEIHTALSRSRRGHHRDQHLQRHDDRAARFPFSRRTGKRTKRSGVFPTRRGRSLTSAHSSQEINLAAARVARHAADTSCERDRPAALCRGIARSAAGDRVAFARCERSQFSRGDVRSDSTGLRRPGEGAPRRRRRSFDGGNHFRHVERQSRDRGDHGDFREIRADPFRSSSPAR